MILMSHEQLRVEIAGQLDSSLSAGDPAVRGRRLNLLIAFGETETDAIKRSDGLSDLKGAMFLHSTQYTIR